MAKTAEAAKRPKGLETRQIIIDSAYSCFLKNGFHGTSMRAIAKAAGLALGGIYNHFEGKEEIFQAVILTHHPLLKIFPKLLEERSEPITSAEALLRETTHGIFAELNKEPALLNLMFIELVELDGANLGALFPVLQPTIAAFLQQVVTLQPNWRIPSPIVFIRSYIGLIMSIVITDRYVPKALLGQAEDVGELDDFLEIYFHGLFKDSPSD